MNMPVKRNENGILALSRLSDRGLAQLQQDVNDEIIRREAEKQKRRKDWISSMVREFSLRAGSYVKMDTTVVVVIKWNGAVRVGKTTPTRNDKFDLDTGVAVAYCKAIGLRVPDFI
jgi:hypothetical protein